MDDDLNILIKNAYTVHSLKKRLKALRSYLSGQIFGKTLTGLSADDTLWINSLPKNFLEKFSKDNLTGKLSELEDKTNKIPSLTIYLPFEANGEAIRMIGSKVEQLFMPGLLLDIKYDPNLLAGCALVWKGVYRDYSLRAKIEERKGEILESFKKFLR